MNHIRWVWMGLVALTAGLWLAADPVWQAPATFLALLLLVAGVASALTFLQRKAGQYRRVVGEITGVNYSHHLQVLEVAVQVKGRWGGHEAGQFAFLNFDGQEGPHRFTITSSWRGDGRLRFLIKGPGDANCRLPARPRVGDRVRVEVPDDQGSASTATNPGRSGSAAAARTSRRSSSA